MNMKRAMSAGRRGFAHVGILMLFLAVGTLVTTVYVAKNGTDLGSFAAQKGKQSYAGDVKKLSVCIQRGVCHQLVNTTDGANHYLVGQSGILEKRINLDDYVGRRVSVSGIEWIRKNITYLVVQKIGKEKTGVSSSLNVTEIGVVEKISVEGPFPTDGVLPISQTGDNGKCLPRPACLDVNPPCNVSPLPPGVTYCPPVPKPVSQFSLVTSDGRRYPLVLPTYSCPKGKICIQMMPRFWNLDEFVGKTVFVEGSLQMGKTPKYCPEIYPPLPGCGGSFSWWPLQNGLNFDVKNVQEAKLINKSVQLSGSLMVLDSNDPKSKENVYLLTTYPPDSKKYFVRSSYQDLSVFNYRAVDFVGSTYLVGNEMYFNLNSQLKLACNVMVYKADANSKPPYSNLKVIDPNNTKIKPGEYYAYAVRINSLDYVKSDTYITTMQQLHGKDEPIEFQNVDTKYCSLDKVNKTSKCVYDALPQPGSQYYVLPTNHVFKVLSPFGYDPKTSTLFNVSSSRFGSAVCASMLFYDSSVLPL